MDLTVYHNGELIKSSEAKVSLNDHAVLFGDALKVNIRVYDNNIFLFNEHIDMLYRAIERIGLTVSLTPKAIEKTIKVLLELNYLQNALVSIIITRGEACHNLDNNLAVFPHVFIMTNPVPLVSKSAYIQGVNISISNSRAAPKSYLASDIPTISRQADILALYSAQKNGAFDTLRVTMEGHIADAVRSSVFIVKENNIFTPDMECGGFDRIERRLIMKLAEELKIKFFEAFLPIDKFLSCDECFLVSTETGIIPAVKINGRKITDGYPGKITRRLADAFTARTLGKRPAFT